MSKSQRTKGANGEREVCKLIFEILGIEAHRNLSQTRDGGADIKLPPYSLEVKRRARIGNVYDWMDQAENGCSVNEKPAVVFRADGKKWLACIPLDDFLSLAREDIVNPHGNTNANASTALDKEKNQ